MPGKLEVGETLREVFVLYREHAGLLLPIAFWLFLAVAILEGLAGEGLGLSLLVFALGIVVGTLYQGVVVGLVRDARSGKRDLSMGELLGNAAPFVLPLAAAGILAALGIALGLLLLIVPGLILLTIWAVIAPAIVIEGRGVTAAFRRSRALVDGQGWAVFGVIITALLIAILVALMLAGIAESIADGPLLEIVFRALASTVTAPIEGLVAAVLYYRLLALKPLTAAESEAAPGDDSPPATA